MALNSWKIIMIIFREYIIIKYQSKTLHQKEKLKKQLNNIRKIATHLQKQEIKNQGKLGMN
jgi:hypothetical protein